MGQAATSRADRLPRPAMSQNRKGVGGCDVTHTHIQSHSLSLSHTVSVTISFALSHTHSVTLTLSQSQQKRMRDFDLSLLPYSGHLDFGRSNLVAPYRHAKTFNTCLNYSVTVAIVSSNRHKAPRGSGNQLLDFCGNVIGINRRYFEQN